MHLCTLVTDKYTNDLGVPIVADHIRSLTERYDSNSAGVGYPLVRQLERYLR